MAAGRFAPRIITRTLDIAGRAPPHDDATERAVLSACIASPQALDDSRSTGLRADQFYARAHQRIYQAACDVADIEQPVDVTTVSALLRERNELAPIGGISYLVEIVDASPSFAHVDAHARILIDLARRRQFIDALSKAQGEAWTHTGTTDAMIADALSRLDGASVDGVPNVTIAYDAVKARMATLAEQWDGKREQTGMPSHLPLMQTLLGGYRLSAASVLAGPTGGGKSSAALQEVLGIAGSEYNGEKIGCVVISLEMDCDENIDRAIAIESGVPDQVLQVGPRNDDDHDAIFTAANRVAQKPLWFMTSEVDLHGIRAAWRRADREMQKHGDGRRVRFVLVDFLGLVKLDDAERHDIALSNLTRGLKMFAMAENVHVMSLCQYNRGSALRSPWDEPQLADLKDSSGIEQNANQVIMIHRVEGEDYAGLCVRKNRKGEKGVAHSRFNGASYRFETPTEGDMERWRAAREAGKNRRRKR